MRPRRDPERLSRRRLALVLTVGVVVALTSTAAGCRSEASVSPVPSTAARSASASAPAAAPSLETRALRRLSAWDAARADAYAAGSVAALRDLYVGTVGAADMRVLRSYLRRGLRVQGMQMQIVGLSVLGHQPGRWRLRVTDRLHHAVAVGHGQRIVLPSDRPSSRVVVLVKGADATWRASAIRG